jgi:excisionase family DNA binding protein
MRKGDFMATTEAAPTGNLVGTSAIAKRLNMSHQAINRMAEKGIIPAYKLDTRWRYDLAEFEQWLKDNHNRNKAESPTAA